MLDEDASELLVPVNEALEVTLTSQALTSQTLTSQILTGGIVTLTSKILIGG
jgi:hypothetical protein